jgi:signal peptidase II
MKIKKQDYIFIFLSLGLILLDQATKFLIRFFMEKGHSVALIPNILHITYIQNTGIAFGFFQNSLSLLIWLSVIVLGLVLYFYDKIHFVPRALLVAGIIGNLIDRIFLRFVVDFIDFRIWPSFNVADSCLTIGVILLIIFIIKKK